MRIVITGGAGFIGKKLARALLERGTLETASGREPIERLVLFDVVRAEGLPEDRRLEIQARFGGLHQAASLGADLSGIVQSAGLRCGKQIRVGRSVGYEVRELCRKLVSGERAFGHRIGHELGSVHEPRRHQDAVDAVLQRIEDAAAGSGRSRRLWSLPPAHGAEAP